MTVPDGLWAAVFAAEYVRDRRDDEEEQETFDVVTVASIAERAKTIADEACAAVACSVVDKDGDWNDFDVETFRRITGRELV